MRRKLLLMLLLAFASEAQAGDFTGFYAGINAGYARGHERDRITRESRPSGLSPDPICRPARGTRPWPCADPRRPALPRHPGADECCRLRKTTLQRSEAAPNPSRTNRLPNPAHVEAASSAGLGGGLQGSR